MYDAGVMTMFVPAPSAIRPASILVFMPPLEAGAGIPRHGLDPADLRNQGICWACASSLGGAVEFVHVRQQHQAIGRHHARNARREPVVVAVYLIPAVATVSFSLTTGMARSSSSVSMVWRVEIALALPVAERQQICATVSPDRAASSW